MGTIFKTIRDKIIIGLKAENLLVGDVLLISMGEVMTAEFLVIEGNGIKIDESSLIEESNPLSKEKYEECILKQSKKVSPQLIFQVLIALKEMEKQY